jgi:hypothetical protein
MVSLTWVAVPIPTTVQATAVCVRTYASAASGRVVP